MRVAALGCDATQFSITVQSRLSRHLLESKFEGGAMHSSSSSDQDTVDRLAEEFVARHRRGEHPDLAEYTQLSPVRRGDP
jgi:hypothetical protein